MDEKTINFIRALTAGWDYEPGVKFFQDLFTPTINIREVFKGTMVKYKGV